MPRIIFEDHMGNEHFVEANPGESVMLAATGAGIEGILADCGGGCSCATCHCYVDAQIFADPDPIESQMLDCVLDRKPESRLSCQLDVTDDMEGMKIRLPASQV